MPQVTRYVRTLNKAQQIALKRVFDRGPIKVKVEPLPESALGPSERAISYREFRRKVAFSYPDCAMVQWCGMWLGIEQDGYTHS